MKPTAVLEKAFSPMAVRYIAWNGTEGGDPARVQALAQEYPPPSIIAWGQKWVCDSEVDTETGETVRQARICHPGILAEGEDMPSRAEARKS